MLAGDQSGNLLWRITMGGEWPTVHMPKTVYILIGTNDLTFADCNNDVQEIEDAATGIIDRSGMSLWFGGWQNWRSALDLLLWGMLRGDRSGMRVQGDADNDLHSHCLAVNKDCTARHHAKGRAVLGMGPGLVVAQPLPAGHSCCQRRLLCALSCPPCMQSG